MTTGVRLGLTLLALAFLARDAHGSTILGLGEQSVLAQGLFADLAVASVAADQNPAASYFLHYDGSTVGTSWGGTLTGQFFGTSSTGSLAGTISPDSTGTDPTWMIESGSTLTVGGTPYTLSGTFGFDANLNGSVNFTATRTQGGVTTTINWTNVGDLKTMVNVNPIGTTFSGTLLKKQNGKADAQGEMAFTISPELGTTQSRITSTITSAGATRTINQGKFTATKQTSFDSDESIDIFSAPGPASLILLALGLTVLVRAR
jgi:hypothetical protein